VREVEGLSLKLGLDRGPGLGLGSVGEKVHDNGSSGDSLVHLEEVLAGDPAVLDGLLPRSSVLAHSDDDVEAVVAEVETLAVALGTVADQRKSVILEVLLDLLQRPVRALVDGLLCSSKVNGPNTPSLVSQARNSSNSGPSGSSGNHEAALLDDGDNLAGEV